MTRSSAFHHAVSLFSFLLLIAPASAAPAPENNYVWIEGEAAKTNFKPNIAGWGKKHFLSGEKWLQIAVDADKIEKTVPAEGVLLKYPFTLPKAGDYEIWNRLGFEFVRSSFAWRIDGGDWKTILPDELTTDLMEVDFFCEVAWLKMGERKLDAGAHTLE